MKKYSLSDWASISEITASIVIVISLVYVGYELKQNTKALQQGSYQSVMDRMLPLELALSTDPMLAGIYLQADVDPFELSPIDWYRYTRFSYPRFGEFEHLYLSHNTGSISEMQWSAFEPYFVDLACKPGPKRFWSENRHAWSAEFVDYMENVVHPGCEP